MPATALLAPVAPSPRMELPTVSFFGRSFEEYTRFFALDPLKLRGRAVLDVAAGPSAFVLEANRRGADAVAVDPLYQAAPGALALRVREDYARMFAQVRAKPRLFRLGGAYRPVRGVTRNAGRRPRPAPMFATFAAAESDRRAAAQRFLDDYEGNARHGRYVRGALPLLPFLDGAFDLVLCAHLLFIYGACFDFDWHLAACTELMRVSAGEVRIHPVCGPDGRPYAELARLQGELRERGLHSAVVPVDYEFFAGSSSMLVLTRVTTA